MRAPRSQLLPFVQRLWIAESATGVAPREKVLPTASAHIVFRLAGPALTIADGRGLQSIGYCIFGGPRDHFYERDVSCTTSSVGAQFWPGALSAITGVAAMELAGRHLALEYIWADAERFRQRLLAAVPNERLNLFEDYLLARLSAATGMAPAVKYALQALPVASVTDVVERTGYSHRHFLDMFVAAVGMTPKRYARIARFQNALRMLKTHACAEVSYANGYGDQAHFSREFKTITGLTPGEYQRVVGVHKNHVPIMKPANDEVWRAGKRTL